MDNPLDEFTDRPGLAKLLNCAPRTIARYEREPDGLPSQSIGGKKLYRLPSVQKVKTGASQPKG